VLFTIIYRVKFWFYARRKKKEELKAELQAAA
jgi:hypothetical protein